MKDYQLDTGSAESSDAALDLFHFEQWQANFLAMLARPEVQSLLNLGETDAL
ncbi:MAG: hypothetical protein K1X67_01500 [Fimbriimonadaceae bacterium]|nr:hypothetical protein [Fimbriimonadaceae bacterium]